MKNTIIIILILLGIGGYLYVNRNKTVTVEHKGLSLKYGYEIRGAGSKIWEHGKARPLIILLHDKGQTSQELYQKLMYQIKDKYRFLLLTSPYQKISAFGWSQSSEDFILSAEALQRAIEMIIPSLGIVGKPILTGYGEGATMLYFLATNYGTQYSYAFGVGGLLDGEFMIHERDRLDGKKYVHIYSFQGVEPLEEHKMAENMVIQIRRKNFDIDIIDVPGNLEQIFGNKNDLLSDEMLMRIIEN